MKQPVFQHIYIHTNIDDAPLPDYKKARINTGTRRKESYVIPIYAGYDVETTTVMTFEGQRSAVYSHAIALANMTDCHVYLMRTWDQFMCFIDRIRDHYELSKDNRLLMWVANLSFEFSFLQHRFQWDQVFAKETYQPLLAASEGLEFRECLTISGGSLETTAKDYCFTQKMVGDLDYKKLRNYSTPIDPVSERGYIVNDVVILAEYSKYLFREIIRPKRYVPMTKTGILASNMGSDFHSMSKRFGSGSETMYKKYIQKCYPDESTYFHWFKYLFRGGYVHANALYSNIDLYNIRMKDITSSYPTQMTLGYVPHGKFEKTEWDLKLLKSKCCIIYAKFYNIRSTTQHSIESENKCIDYKDAHWDNGRLIRAKELSVCLTELDYDTYCHYYTWDECEIYDFYTADRGTLPSFVMDGLLDAYKEKTKLKRTGKHKDPEWSAIYAAKKAEVNTWYGLLVKRIRLDIIAYTNEGGWTTLEKKQPYDKEVKKSLLLPQWGIWITAQARHTLLMMTWRLIQAGVIVVYMDTDSIKYIDHPAAERIFKRYNMWIRKRLKNRGYTDEFIAGLGEFEDELDGASCRFKTEGAKRYIFTDPYTGTVIATIAGMPKTAIHQLGDEEDDIYNKFSDLGFALAPGDSGKLRPDYTDEPYDIYVDGEWMHEESGCSLVETSFSMKLDELYARLLCRLQEEERITK